jgi:hypothetical protein
MLKGIAAVLFSATYLFGVSSDARWSASLQPQNGAKVSGTATVEAKGADSTRFTVSVKGAAPNATLAWHMHNGKCTEEGSIVGTPTDYPELKPGSSGSAEAMVTLPVAPPAGGTFSIQVHRPAAGGEGGAPSAGASAMGSKATVACGELKPLGSNP